VRVESRGDEAGLFTAKYNYRNVKFSTLSICSIENRPSSGYSKGSVTSMECDTVQMDTWIPTFRVQTYTRERERE